jgi:uncharacterized RDD family membrane protein YckC
LNDPAQHSTGAGSLAGLARRLGSIGYEALLLTAVLFLSTWIFLFFGQFLDATIARALLQLWLLAITGTYLVYCWTHGGQTLPMKTWHVRLAKRDGGTVPMQTAVKRFFLVLLSAGACGLGFAWALVDRERQFLHDRLAGTRLFVLTG